MAIGRLRSPRYETANAVLGFDWSKERRRDAAPSNPYAHFNGGTLELRDQPGQLKGPRPFIPVVDRVSLSPPADVALSSLSS